jgi:DNA-binding MarR family transcriptional regulator
MQHSAEHDLRILETLEENPEITQAGLAARLGVAVGSANWYLKRLVHKGYVKVAHLQRRKMKYFVTPEGLALKARLTLQYMRASLRTYRELRQAAQEVLRQVRQAGYAAVRIDDQDEAAEIFCLTCLEEGVRVEKGSFLALPKVRAEGTRFVVELPEGGSVAAPSPGK